MSKKENRKGSPIGLVTLTNPSSPIAEQYRTIRTNLQFASTLDQKIKSLVVTSAGPGEGKSTTASNLAVVFANSGSRVLLVGADLRKPTIFKVFNLLNTTGLSNLLSTDQSLASFVQPTTIENLSILTSGPKPPNPSELLNSQKMVQVIEEAKRQYDIVIFDMPPVVAVTDAQIVASKVDGTLLVVREKITKKESLTKANELLKLVNAHVVGVVYNGAEQDKDQGYYYY